MHRRPRRLRPASRSRGGPSTGSPPHAPLQGAIACLDTNDNRVCDSGEPTSAATGVDGGFVISVADAAQAGAHRIIVDVPATAIDADTGAAVGAAFSLMVPASGTSGAQSVFVSPLTTLVQQHMDASGLTRTQAATYIQQQAGLAVSPLADFTSATNADNAKAANVAKLTLQTTIQQSAAVASAIGQTDASGAIITRAEVERAVLDKVVAALPVISAAAVDPAVINLTGTAREQALASSAATVVAGIGFTPDQARLVVGIQKIPQPPPAAPAAGANLVVLQYTDAANWFQRYNAATAADNTPDANGLTRFYSVRTRMAPYAYEPTQGVAESDARTSNPEFHWDGSEWTRCELSDRGTQTVRDSQGRSTYETCRGYDRGVSQRAEVDIAGQTLADVWTNRILVEQARTNSPGNWSIPSVALLGTATFPSGSRLILQTNTLTDAAITYNRIDTNRVSVPTLEYAQGGDARTGSPACAGAFTTTLAANLEQLVERSPGQPCLFSAQTNDPNGTSLDPNEIWGPTTVSMGTLAINVERPTGTGTYYTTTRLLRVSFPSAGNTVYWSCLQRTTGLGTRNCSQIGTGTYAISTLGDARVMTFSNLPAAAQSMGTTRVFVERAGAVYFGFRNRIGTQTTNVRLNLPAANAVLSQLGMPSIQPVDAPRTLPAAKAANASLLHGVWATSDANGVAVLRFGPNGEYLMAQASPADSVGRPGIEQGYADFDLAADQQLGLALEVDSNNQRGLSHPIPNDRITSITDTAINFGDGSVVSRLAEDLNGIVGMWAMESTTDFKTTHFIFFPNGKALSIHPAETSGACATARQGPPGVEYSDYTFDAGTGTLTLLNRTIDTSGCTGAWDATNPAPPASVSFTITMAPDRRSFTVPVDGGTAVQTAYRITANP
jgi:trimeric autotransporter adhesin